MARVSCVNALLCTLANRAGVASLGPLWIIHTHIVGRVPMTTDQLAGRAVLLCVARRRAAGRPARGDGLNA
eukprot:SAG31_NODE_1502_length_8080_cov_131.725849_3_plen_71_part_00